MATDEIPTKRQEVLKLAIAKAYANGWLEMHGQPWTPVEGEDICFIYTHDFARALFGNDYLLDGVTIGECRVMLDEDRAAIPYVHQPKAWKWHLQMMVIADDPLAYIAEHMDEGGVTYETPNSYKS